MHKKMQALSLLCRDRGNPLSARRAIGRAQCNDAYWHGVFGGLYLPHLREAIWKNLALAEAELRRAEGLSVEIVDLDADGHDEVWVHSDQFSAILSPRRGGAVEEYTLFSRGINYANTLTRRREAYHDTMLEQQAEANAGFDGASSIHDIEAAVRLGVRPPLDSEPRAVLLERILSGELTLEQYAAGDYRPARSWARLQCTVAVDRQHDLVAIVCTFGEDLEKRVEFAADGSMTVTYQWDPSAGNPDDWFATELSLFAPLQVRSDPPAELWSFPIETVAKSERGLDRTRQGDSVTLRWPVQLGRAGVQISARSEQLVEVATVAD
jgi:hypothetical protein